MNRYRIKPGTTISDIENFAQGKRWIFKKGGGSWIYQDAKYVMFIYLDYNISIDMAFPENLEKWDDFNYILVMDEFFGQPYTPFYDQMKNQDEIPFPVLQKIIDQYNEALNKCTFLERIA